MYYISPILLKKITLYSKFYISPIYFQLNFHDYSSLNEFFAGMLDILDMSKMY